MGQDDCFLTLAFFCLRLEADRQYAISQWGKIMSKRLLMLVQTIIVVGIWVIMAEPSGHAATASADEIKAVQDVIHETAERWNSQDFSSVLELWDPAEEVPFYLAEEQDDWFIGWEPLKAYLDPPRPSPAVEALREEMRDISVKLIASDLAIAAWNMHFEMKMRGRKAIGEEVRVSAVLRKTKDGWRYIHWAESPMTAMMYMDKLFQRDVDHDKFNVVLQRGKARREATR